MPPGDARMVAAARATLAAAVVCAAGPAADGQGYGLAAAARFDRRRGRG